MYLVHGATFKIVFCLVCLTYANVLTYAIHEHGETDGDCMDRHHAISQHELVKEFEQTFTTSQDQCNYARENQRFDCYPDNYKSISRENCEKRGCCWMTPTEKGAPECFYPKIYPGYKVTYFKPTKFGYTANLTRGTPSSWPDDVKTLRLDVMLETVQRVHFKIYDPIVKRFEVPLDLPRHDSSVNIDATDYAVDVDDDPFSITVTRKSTGNVIFTSKDVAPFIFADQFIQFGTQLSSPYLYGLGEHRGALLLDLMWSKLSFWACDQPPVPNSNLYGVHLFYLNVEEDANMNGVFLANSNAMQVDLQETPALTYRTTGGILDFYVFLGPTANDVIRQYTEVIGRPRLPPFWSLGFHLCRWGLDTTENLSALIKRMRAADMPYDTQWSDIDYMHKRLDFTKDADRYGNLSQVVDDLHKHGQHYIPIVDPGISNVQAKGTYPPYDDGLKQGVFVMKSDGSGPIVGKVWPGTTVFPDFFNNKTIDWWYKQMKGYHDKVAYDGLWIDMNEPSNFVTGSTEGCPQDRYNNPPFKPQIQFASLEQKTLCPSAKHAVSNHYNLHNLYGFSEARATARALDRILNKRSIAITRSSFASTGRYAGHWSGDNNADWVNMAQSIPAIINFQMFGMPLTGADICGFQGKTTPELCTRWMQLGAFYPFMRNHNTKGAPDQDPAAFDKKTQSMMRSALDTRYHLLPYLYTLFYHSASRGDPVVKPLFFNFPSRTTYSIDRQFMWGDALLISPILNEGEKTVTAYLPAAVWYDYYTGEATNSSGAYVTLPAPLDTINLHIRAASILPTLPPANTTTAMRLSKFGLLVALSSESDASGDLYWDDGEELDVVSKQHFSYITFHSPKRKNLITSAVVTRGYKPRSQMLLGSARMFGVSSKPSHVTVDGVNVHFSYNSTRETLDLSRMSVDLLKPFHIQWQ